MVPPIHPIGGGENPISYQTCRYQTRSTTGILPPKICSLTASSPENIVPLFDSDDECIVDELPPAPIEVNNVAFQLPNDSLVFERYGSFNKDIHMFQNLPLTFDDATTGPDAALWVDPIRDELRALKNIRSGMLYLVLVI